MSHIAAPVVNSLEVTTTVTSNATSSQFIDLVAKNNTTAAIGADLLKLKPLDCLSAIRKKMDAACHRHPDHLVEIMLAGMTAIVFSSESKEETLESCMFAFQVADRTFAH